MSLPNFPPAIVSLASRDHIIAPGDSVLIECVALDVDGDAITYNWTCDRGVINGQAGVIAWTAPAEEGLARVTVVISDGGAGDGQSEHHSDRQKRMFPLRLPGSPPT